METDTETNVSLQQSESRNDSFAQIAVHAEPTGRKLCENVPEMLPDIDLSCGDYQAAQDFTPLRHPSTPEDLRADLERLRSAFLPFLQQLAPELPSTRQRQTIREAMWQLAGDKDLREPSDAAGWTPVKLPHYGGPIGPATAFYQCEVEIPDEAWSAGHLYLVFRGADYRVQVFLNGVFLLEHEGFFEPFEADITRVARPGRNTLLVRVENDYVGQGNDHWGQKGYGEKLYAATGLGWDEPGLGWHHCPPGMGLWQEVYWEARPALHVDEAWVRPLPDEERAMLHVNVRNASCQPQEVEVSAGLFGSNFKEKLATGIGAGEWRKAEPGLNLWQFTIGMPGFRRWSPEEPWLYEAQVSVRRREGAADTVTTTFGMRTFAISEEGADKGRLYLNGDEIRLRGANTMGHEQQCVFHGDFDQLRDDILIARHAGLNFLRITQRPVQREVYEMCDRLGMMVQTDLPLFGKVPRTQFAEGVRQAGAMERLIRGHACCVLVSFINEPFPLEWGDTTHRHMTRPEIEAFLRACAENVRMENPDRQIKPVDGDYDPPAPGLPDNHCYCGWYVGHGLDLGKLHRGHWVATKPGWRYACGEYGAEGLESVDLMRRRYPAGWLPGEEDEADWTPSRIARAQTGPMHLLWMDPATTLARWVANSQEHQAWSVRLMTRAFRRDRRMVSFAVHLLIDAFPAGWMKTLVDCERNPKPAYFAFREALQPLLVDARMDRWGWWGGETASAEIWICHDDHKPIRDCRLRYVLEAGGETVASGESRARVPKCDSLFQGSLRLPLPAVTQRTPARLRVGLVDAEGHVLNDTEEHLVLFPATSRDEAVPPLSVASDDDPLAATFVEGLGQAPQVAVQPRPGETIVASRSDALGRLRPAIEAGATLLLLELPAGTVDVGDDRVTVEDAGYGPRHFVSRATGHPLVADFGRHDFRFWHEPAADSVTALLDRLFFAPGWTPILSTVQAGWHEEGERAALACAERSLGKGRVVICQIKLAGRLATNPSAARFARVLIGGVPGSSSR